MIPSQLQDADGNVIRHVKNLGWLLRNWKQVDLFTIQKHPETKTPGMAPECLLTAHLRDGRRYVSGFMCADVCRRWLDRPVFRGVPVGDLLAVAESP